MVSYDLFRKRDAIVLFTSSGNIDMGGRSLIWGNLRAECFSTVSISQAIFGGVFAFPDQSGDTVDNALSDTVKSLSGQILCRTEFDVSDSVCHDRMVRFFTHF